MSYFEDSLFNHILMKVSKHDIYKVYKPYALKGS